MNNSSLGMTKAISAIPVATSLVLMLIVIAVTSMSDVVRDGRFRDCCDDDWVCDGEAEEATGDDAWENHPIEYNHITILSES